MPVKVTVVDARNPESRLSFEAETSFWEAVTICAVRFGKPAAQVMAKTTGGGEVPIYAEDDATIAEVAEEYEAEELVLRDTVSGGEL